MLKVCLSVGFLLLGTAMLLAFIRLLRGPHPLDRALALDTMTTNAAALLVLYSIYLGSTEHFELALLIALLGFVGSAAVGRFVSRGRLLE